MEIVEDHILLQQLLSGKTNAYDIVYDKYWEGLFLYTMRIVKDAGDAEDLVQESFMALWRMNTKLGQIQSLKAYLFAVARNKALKHIQANVQKLDYVDSLVQYFSDKSENPEEKVVLKELNAFIDHEIDKLPEKMKEVFLLSRKEHLSYKEIAERLGISDETVRKQIHRSLKYLKTKINREYLSSVAILLICKYL
ncbi:RNA polymerase sigma-70 factor [Olivibacter sp. SDN3]|uniref:RNA polymerase sigma factor n=1 Tax=Olivibacter sp. SDN3 TaxID=2764720 RepID=UPI001650E168|nr:RNA polymerase sigma-70 factor [Olivibacter sp. SDN3]QNL51750.1 RNA polymerase sigma-70 factor [Olivibacter sp. SDN3]